MRRSVIFLTIIIFMCGCDKTAEIEEVKRDTDFELFMEQIQGDWKVQSFTTPLLSLDIGDWTQMILTIKDVGDDSVGYLTSINRPTSDAMEAIWPENSSWRKYSMRLIGDVEKGAGGSLIRSDGIVLDFSISESKMEVIFTPSGDFYATPDGSEVMVLVSSWEFIFVRK